MKGRKIIKTLTMVLTICMLLGLFNYSAFAIGSKSAQFIRWNSTSFGEAWNHYNDVRGAINTTDGSYVVVGNSSPAENKDYTQHAYITKYNKDGTIAWDRVYGGGADGQGTEIAGKSYYFYNVIELSNGDFLAVGTTNDGNDYVDQDSMVIPSPSFRTIFAARIDNAGNTVWQKNYGIKDQQTNIDAWLPEENQDGSISICGSYWRQYNYYDRGYPVIIELKLSSDGSLLERYLITDDFGDNTFDTGGYFCKRTYEGGFIAIQNACVAGSAWTDSLVKLDSNGTKQWGFTLLPKMSSTDSTKSQIFNSVISVIPDGYIVAGMTPIINDTESNNALIVYKVDNDGNLKWSKIYRNITLNNNIGGVSTYNNTADDVFITVNNGYSTRDFTMIKIKASDGSAEWVKSYGNKQGFDDNYGGNASFFVLGTSDNNIIGVGGTYITKFSGDGSIGFLTDDFTVQNRTNYTVRDVEVDKYDGGVLGRIPLQNDIVVEVKDTAILTGLSSVEIAAVLVNAVAPVITAQPEDKIVNVGETAELTLTATGDSLTYQWYSNTIDSNTGGNIITGATGSSYSAPSTTAGTTYYYCVVTNTDQTTTGNKTATAVSNAAKVVVKAAVALPYATNVRIDGSAVVGSTLTGSYTFNASGSSASESGTTFKWIKYSSNETDIFNSGNVGAVEYYTTTPPTNPTVFTLTEDTFISYINTYHWNSGTGTTTLGTISLVEKGGAIYGPWQTVGTAGMYGVPNANWNAYPNIVLPAGTYTVVDSDPVTWSRNRSSDYRGFSLIRSKSAINENTPIAGVDTKTYTLTSEDIGRMIKFEVTVKDSEGNVGIPVASSVVGPVLAEANAAAPVITAQPADKTVNVGETAELTVTATGDSLTYQWYSNTINSSTGGNIITGATASSYSAPTTTAGTTYYYCVVTNTDQTATGNKTATINSNSVAVNVTINKYTVTFDSKSGSSVDSLAADYNTTITAPAVPSRTGYTFGGWYKETECINAWNFATDKVTGDTTLYAKWIKSNCTVTFNSQGGSAVSSKITNYNSTITTPKAPKKANYIFGGWYKEAEYVTAWNFATDKVTGDTTLYAKWIKSKFTVIFNSQGGSTVSSKITNYNSIIKAPKPPRKEGYTFGGWYKEAECVNAWNFTTDKTTADTTLYAKWTINKYTVIFNSQGGDAVSGTAAEYNSVILAPSDPTKLGYTFGGWYKDSKCKTEWNFLTDKITANTTLYAKWLINNYTVTFDSQGGNVISNMAVNYNNKIKVPKAPTKVGYKFGGWYTEAELTNAWNFSKRTVTSDIILYAKWTINKYKVSFNSKGGSAVASNTADYNSLITEPTTPKKAGYTFGGWYKEAGCTNVWNFATDKVTANTKLYAKWIKV